MNENNQKLYYSIGEVAGMFNVNSSLIRYWEKRFSVINPKKNKKGNRFFTEKDIKNFKLIYHLVKERGMTLKGAEQKLRENREDTVNNSEVIDRLKDIKQQLLDLRDEV